MQIFSVFFFLFLHPLIQRKRLEDIFLLRDLNMKETLKQMKAPHYSWPGPIQENMCPAEFTFYLFHRAHMKELGLI